MKNIIFFTKLKANCQKSLNFDKDVFLRFDRVKLTHTKYDEIEGQNLKDHVTIF